MNINGESDSLNTQELDFKTQNIDLAITTSGITNFLGDLKLNGVDVGRGGNNNGHINNVNKITFDNNNNAEIYNENDININTDGGYVNIKGDGLKCDRETCYDVMLQPSQYLILGDSQLQSASLQAQQIQILSSNELNIQTDVKCGNINATNATTTIGGTTPFQSLKLADGTANVFIGSNGIHDTSVGSNLTTGTYNTFMGGGSGKSISSGGYNTCIGGSSGVNINTANGNVNIGSNSGYDITSGSYNTTIGISSGNGITTGEDNVFLGSQSGQSNVTGAKNIAIGTTSNVANGLNNQIAIGYGAETTTANSCVIGNTTLTSISPMVGNSTCDLGSDTNRFNRGYFNEVFVTNNTLFIGTEFKMYVDSGTLNIAHLDGNGEIDNVTVLGTTSVASDSAPITKAYVDAQIALLVADITAIQTELISAVPLADVINVPQLTGPITTVGNPSVTFTVTHSTYLNLAMDSYPGWHAFNDTMHCFTGAGMTDNENGVTGNFLKLAMSKSYTVSNYRFNSMYDNGERPTKWVLYHSMDDVTWFLADDQRYSNYEWEILSVPSRTGLILLANPIVARYLLLIITENVVTGPGSYVGSCVNKLVYG
jgi:hypothetical protein